MEKEIQRESVDKVVVYGAKTLKQFTDGILIQGFKEASLVGQGFNPNTQAIVYQIHGAPQAEENDKIIINKIKRETVQDDGIKRVILLHRPDEIQLRYPELKNILTNANNPLGLVMLGDMHIDDDFFKAKNVERQVIPHGFFENIPTKLQSDPIIVGSHTTWGEMRSTEHVLKLLGEIYRSKDGQTIAGYLGGKPKDQLQIKFLQEQWNKHNTDVSVIFTDVHDKDALETKRGENIVLVDSTNTMPDGVGLTYNVQLYYLNDQVRTGESSGSAHSSVSIPVVLEMNRSEVIEDLKVVKIPYGSQDNIGTIDFRKGADLIFQSIRNGNFVEMHKHNLAQSKKFSPIYVANQYKKLFEHL